MASKSGRLRMALAPALARLRANIDSGTRLDVCKEDSSITEAEQLRNSKVYLINCAALERKTQASIDKVAEYWKQWNELVEDDPVEEEQQESWIRQPNHNVQDILDEGGQAIEDIRAKSDSAAVFKEDLEKSVLGLSTSIGAHSLSHAPPVLASSAPGASSLAAPRLNLPILKPPTFNGKFTDWPQFWQLFQSTVDVQPIPDIQKLSYLISLLEGEARRLVDGYFLEENNYEIIKTILISKYDRKDVIESRLLEELMALNPPTERINSLRPFVNELDRIRRRLENMQVHMDGSLATQIIHKKLPHHVLVQVVSEKEKQRNWNLEMLCEMLSRIVNTREEVERFEQLKISETNGRRSDTVVRTFASTAIEFPCLFCREKGHRSADCKKVIDTKERKSILLNSRRCFRCLSSSHTCNNCQKTCFICRGAHHVSICYDRLKDKGPEGFRSPATGVNAMQTSGSRSTYCSFGSSSGQSSRVENSLVKETGTFSTQTNQSVLPVAIVEICNPTSKKATKVAALLDTGSNETYITNELMQMLKLTSKGSRDVRVETFGGRTLPSLKGHAVDISIKTLSGVIRIDALAVPQLMPITTISQIQNGEVFTTRQKPQLLLGKHDVWSVLRVARKSTSDGCSYIETEVGPVVISNSNSESTTQVFHSNRIGQGGQPINQQLLKSIPTMWLRDGREIAPFFTAKYALSNFSPCERGVVYENRWFLTSEHAYQFTKARFFGLHEAAEEVYKAKSPREAKSISNQKINRHPRFVAEKWNGVKLGIMSAICHKKFLQNPKHREILLNTGEALLIEASRDCCWGIGVSMQEITQVERWRGENALGKILMAIRSELKRMEETRSQSWRTPIVSSYLTQLEEVTDYSQEKQNVEEIVENFWKLENMGIDSRELIQNIDELTTKRFRESTEFEEQSGRYVVEWLWNQKEGNLPTNFDLSYFRTKNTLTRLQREPEKLKAYREDFEGQLSRGTIERVTWKGAEGVEHYLPHQAVWTPQKETTKLRIVFDASAKKKGCLALNETMHKGPDTLPLLVGILLRFRINQVGVVSDIEKAFLQLKLKQNQRDAVRFLLPRDWSKPFNSDNLKIFRFTSVCFGVICSPALLALALHLHIESEREVLKNMYVDNIIMTYESSTEAIDHSKGVKEKLQKAHFNLREFYSNSEEIMQQLNPDETSKSTKVLGLKWDLKEDSLTIKTSKFNGQYTKRSVSSYLASFYDPLGLVAPANVALKLFQQKLWIDKVEWDSELSKDQKVELESLFLPDTEVIIPRRMSEFRIEDCSLSIFCDASTKAYGAVAYIVPKEVGCTPTIIYSKVKVNPVNGKLTIPRAELMGCLVGVRISEFLEKQMGKFAEVCVWSDSRIVLDQIENEKEKQSVFVQRRLDEIRQSRNKVEFRYVETKLNPADLLSRGAELSELKLNNLWWGGPKFLKEEKETWPKEKIVSKRSCESEDIGGEKFQSFVVESREPPTYQFVNPQRGPWKKLVGIGCTILTALEKFRKIESKNILQKVRQVTGLLIKDAQRNHPPSKRKELKFRMFEDSGGVIRCHSRLPEAVVGQEIANPIWLPDESIMTEKLVLHTHEELGHSGTQAVLASLRTLYWISSSTVTKALKKCTRCRHFNCKPFWAPVADLPKVRVTAGRPFEATGVDLMGPVQLTTGTVYVALFTCLKVRAVHLEVLKDTTTEQFILTFDRFVARRGLPRLIMSDNATNFQLASKCFNDRFQAKGCQWSFITPRAPWRGGSWERLIRSVKSAMKKCQGRKRLDLWEFVTLITRIESSVNARPLCSAKEEIGFEFLRPIDFLRPNGNDHIEDPLEDMSILDDPDFSEERGVRMALRKRFNDDSARLDRFWNHWRNEYLSSLFEKNKAEFRRQFIERKPRVGELVLIGEDQTPRGQWKLARIRRLVVDRKGEVRTAEIRLPSGKILSRAINLLYPLEVGGELETDEVEEPIVVDDSLTTNSKERPAREAKRRALEAIREESEEDES